jgi:hypothetical protein
MGLLNQVRTRASLFYPKQAESRIAWPKLQYQEKVTSVTKLLSKDEMKKNLGNLTSFHNRYYRSEFGVKSSRWLYNQILDVSIIILDVRTRVLKSLCIDHLCCPSRCPSLSRDIHSHVPPV